jgi:hypothetical protein
MLCSLPALAERRWRPAGSRTNGDYVRSYADAARRWVPLAIVGGLLGVAALAASVASPGVRTFPIPALTQSADGNVTANATAPTHLEGTGTARSPWQLPAWVDWIPAVFAAGLIVGLIVLLILHFARNNWLSVRSVGPDGGGTDAMTGRRQDVIAALDESIAQLAGDGDARSAVIACWVRLEEVAKDAGTPRAPSDAPADLVSRLLQSHQVSSGALTALADLYRTARYSTMTIDASMRQRAVTLLGQIRAELDVPVSGPVDDPYVRTLQGATEPVGDGWSP